MPDEIVFYSNDRGEFPVVSFLDELTLGEFVKCLSYMEALLERGHALPSNYVKPLGGGLWELRPEFGGTEFRFFYFTVRNESIIMLHAVKKKAQKTNPRDIEIAKKRMEETKP